jgi:hypothetical protein
MQEKKLSMDDAFRVWWFMFWRTLLTAIGVSLALMIVFSVIGVTETTQPILQAISCMVSILISVFYLKLAINRNYKNFRLSATVLSTDLQPEQSNE